MSTTPEADAGPGAAARWLVGVTLILLSVPGLIGFELWPMSGWRLFSLARDNSQTQWVLEASTDDGERTVTLEELPLRFRHAAWPMADLPGSDEDRRERVCQALLTPAAEAVGSGLRSLSIVKDRQRLVERDGEWVIEHDPETIHTCEAAR